MVFCLIGLHLSWELPIRLISLGNHYYCKSAPLVSQARACHKQTSGGNNWSPGELREFQALILKYTRENILKINIYIKEPFAKKYIMVEYASMYVNLCQAQSVLVLTMVFQFHLDQQYWRSDGTLYWRKYHHCHRNHLVLFSRCLELFRTKDQCELRTH